MHPIFKLKLVFFAFKMGFIKYFCHLFVTVLEHNKPPHINTICVKPRMSQYEISSEKNCYYNDSIPHSSKFTKRTLNDQKSIRNYKLDKIWNIYLLDKKNCQNPKGENCPSEFLTGNAQNVNWEESGQEWETRPLRKRCLLKRSGHIQRGPNTWVSII